MPRGPSDFYAGRRLIIIPIRYCFDIGLYISNFGRIEKKNTRKWRTLSDLLFYLSLKELWTLFGKDYIGETVLCKVVMFWTRFLTLQAPWLCLCLWVRIHSVCGSEDWIKVFGFNVAEFQDMHGEGMIPSPKHNR